jgi:hypothetical protein
MVPVVPEAIDLQSVCCGMPTLHRDWRKASRALRCAPIHITIPGLSTSYPRRVQRLSHTFSPAAQRVSAGGAANARKRRKFKFHTGINEFANIQVILKFA